MFLYPSLLFYAFFLLFPSTSLSHSHSPSLSHSLPLSLTLRSHYSPIDFLSSFLLHCLPVSFSCPSTSYFLYLPLPSCPLLISYHLSQVWLTTSAATLTPSTPRRPSYDDLQGLCCAPNLKTFKVFPHRDRTAESRPEE
jgi:hypothetical protein